MIGTCMAAVAVFLSSPTGLTTQFFFEESKGQAVAVIAPLGANATKEAEETFKSFERLKRICDEEGWQMKAEVETGLIAVDGSVLPIGTESVAAVTLTINFVENGKAFKSTLVYFSFTREGKRWRLIDIEVLAHKEGAHMGALNSY